jgi:hypothetical protein
MASAFLESSSLMKLYFPERGSAWLTNFVKSNQITVSELALFEAVTTVRRRYVMGSISLTDASNLLDAINNDTSKFGIFPIDSTAQIPDFRKLLFSLPNTLMIRTLDGIHLQAALTAFTVANAATPPETFVFVSSDAQLLRVAQAQKLPTENPEDHP